MRLLDFTTSPILRLLSRPKKPKQPEVAPEIMEGLRRLTKQPDWHLYKQLLDIFVSNQVKALLAASDNDAEVHRLRGYIQGLLHAAQIPEQLVQQEDYARTREQHTASLTASRAESAAASLYATGHWGN